MALAQQFAGKNDLSVFGLGEDVIRCYADHGIVQLFPWQRDCLCLPGVLQGERNLVYTAPTSAGKTLVAEIILLKRVLETGKRGLFILPFISVAREKMLYLHSLYRNVGIQVQGYMGTLNPAGGMHSWDVAVCTIEKANSLVNRLLEEDSMSSLGVIVVDELHLVKDRHRGKVLELLLSKLLYHVRQQQFAYGLSNPIQIIGMSATLPNIEIYGKWLCSEIFRTDFRPIPLTEYLFSNGNFYTRNFELVRSLPVDFVLPNDSENVVGLCLETVIVGCGVLVFCSTKAWCERLALLIAEAIKQLLDCSGRLLLFFNLIFKLPYFAAFRFFSQRNGSLTVRLNALIESEKQKHFMDSFVTIAGIMDPVLRSTLPYAVGFHHAGMTMEERERLENGFRKSLVRVLVATSTLSSGVNLPAKRVIIRSPWGDPSKSGPCLDSYMYKQMTGRAGRKGLDVQGESILMCKQSEIARARSIIAAADALDLPKEAPVTNFCELSSGFVRTVLETIANGMVKCKADLSQFLSCTLSYGFLADQWDAVQQCILSLTERNFVSCSAEENIAPTQLGCATVSSSMAPDEAVAVFQDLQTAKSAVVLENDLHLVYLVTPLCMLDNLASTISWTQYFAIWQSLDQASRKVGQTVGVEESYLVAKLCSFGRRGDTERNARKREVHLRFFVALALFQLVEEVPLAEVSARFSCNRGYLQSLQQQASTYAAMVISFVDRLGWFSLKNLLSGFAERLAFGVKQDLTELVQIDGIDGLRARRFHEAGFATVSKLAQSKIKEISAILGKAIPFHSSLGGSSSKNSWLAGHPELTLLEAATFVRFQARMLLNDKLRQYGVTAKRMEEKEAEEDGEAEEPRRLPGNSTPRRELTAHSILRSTPNKEETRRSFLMNHSSRNNSPIKEDDFLNQFPTTQMVLAESWFEMSARSQSMERKHDEPRNKHNTEEQLGRSDKDIALKITQSAQSERSSRQREAEQPLKDLVMAEQFRSESWCQSSAAAHPDEVNNANDVATNLSGISLSPKPHTSAQGDVSITESQLVQLLSNSFTERIDAACEQLLANSSKPNSSGQHGFLRTSPLVFEDSDEFRDRSGQISDLKEPTDLAHSSPMNEVQTGPTDCPLEVVFQHVSPISTIAKPIVKSGCFPGFEGHLIGGIRFVDIGIDQAVCAEFLRLLEEQHECFVSVAYSEGALQTSPRCPKCQKMVDQSANEASLSRISYSVAVCWNRDFCFYYAVSTGKEGHGDVASILQKILTFRPPSRKVIFDDLRRTVRLLFALLGKDFRAECNCFCLSTAAWMLNPDSRSLHPKELLEIYSPADLPLLRFIPISLGQVSICCMSCIAACLAWPHLYELLERMRMLAAFGEIELPAQWAVAQMETTGIGFDSALCSSMCESLKGRIMELEFDSARLAGRQFSMSSPNEVAKVLFHELGLPADSSHLLSRGNTKRYSTSKPVLEKLCCLHPLPRNVLQWRQLSFALSNYVYPLLRIRSNKCATCGEFTRIYGKYDWFTATGRVIMHEPNLQNVPKSITVPLCGKEISLRNLVVARQGYILLSADFSQLELRIIAHLSSDPKLMSLLNDGQDIFAFLASELNSVHLADVSEEQRSQAKQICYGIIYGMGPAALAEELDISEEMASAFYVSFKRRFPGVASWMQATVEQCRHLGYAITVANRVRYFPEIKSSISSERCQAERRAINTTVQGSASDIFKLAVNAICARLRESSVPTQKVNLITQLHDEVIFEVESRKAQEVAILAKQAMEGAASLKVALVVKLKVGVRWGDMVEISL
ncbi:hypothetical protein M513_07144 [Trichuris suis]|uniref:DNA-directed DNA polymerase n=1 Tax=Trichuris suis TaxID=68888 RepID=A0A085M466_9BILA|nr:hypothetical protein M513_07144 [Trichuris suis]